VSKQQKNTTSYGKTIIIQS